MAKIAKKVKLVNGVRFDFEDKAATKLEVLLADFSPQLVIDLAIHGLSQKLGDSYSGLETVTEAIAAVKEVWANLRAGKFNATGGVGGLLVEAVARIKGITVEEAQQKLSEATEDQLEKLRKNPTVKNMITVIKGERATAKANESEDDLGL